MDSGIEQKETDNWKLRRTIQCSCGNLAYTRDIIFYCRSEGYSYAEQLLSA